MLYLCTASCKRKFDSVQYNVRMWYAVPTPTQTIDLGEITDTKFVNAMATMGVYQLV